MLILASASAARSRLLKQAGIVHKAIISNVNEEDFDRSNPFKLVESLSLAKSQAVAKKIINSQALFNQFNNAKLIIGCDSILEFEGKIFEKPKDKSEAIERLLLMSSKKGILHTGHSLIFRTLNSNSKQDTYFNRELKAVISTDIYFEKMSFLEIKNYVESKEPLLAAGGFTLEGKGAMFIKKIDGCYSNVIGLSLPWLRKSMELISENKKGPYL